ncbi:transcription factor [Diplodia corticola]|uniref:Transcription factor n=1 Tax=Diplodia corticola TaxID=236234 RepID=A0A1J9RXD2_9PEZI|nr:transcription factor [Diplodia corticola]OJD32141.1 transcription factor [Diplodia corticola]
MPRTTLRNSCDRCHKSKVKCVYDFSEGFGCTRCRTRCLECVRSPCKPYGRRPGSRNQQNKQTKDEPSALDNRAAGPTSASLPPTAWSGGTTTRATAATTPPPPPTTTTTMTTSPPSPDRTFRGGLETATAEGPFPETHQWQAHPHTTTTKLSVAVADTVDTDQLIIPPTDWPLTIACSSLSSSTGFLLLHPASPATSAASSSTLESRQGVDGTTAPSSPSSASSSPPTASTPSSDTPISDTPTDPFKRLGHAASPPLRSSGCGCPCAPSLATAIDRLSRCSGGGDGGQLAAGAAEDGTACLARFVECSRRRHRHRMRDGEGDGDDGSSSSAGMLMLLLAAAFLAQNVLDVVCGEVVRVRRETYGGGALRRRREVHVRIGGFDDDDDDDDDGGAGDGRWRWRGVLLALGRLEPVVEALGGCVAEEEEEEKVDEDEDEVQQRDERAGRGVCGVVVKAVRRRFGAVREAAAEELLRGRR